MTILLTKMSDNIIDFLRDIAGMETARAESSLARQARSPLSISRPEAGKCTRQFLRGTKKGKYCSREVDHGEDYCAMCQKLVSVRFLYPIKEEVSQCEIDN